MTTSGSAYDEHDLVRALTAVGAVPGRVLHVHAALFALGAMRGSAAAAMPGRIVAALETFNAGGTLTMPASFENYARYGEPYDCRTSPVDRAQGVLSQAFAMLPGAVRTYCPMCGVAGRGPLADDICHQPTGSAFGSGSAWERLHEHDAQMLFLGVRPALAFTFVMFIQARYGVPYLYNKLYTVPTYENGAPVDLPITYAVRYLDPDYAIVESCEAFEAHLQQAGLIRREPLGRGFVSLVPSARRAFEEGTRCLRKDLYFFLARPPRWVPGRIPTDGNTGEFVSNAERFGSGS